VTAPTLDLGALRSAIASFEDALDVVGDAAWFGAQSARARNTLMAGVIQNFEFVFEIALTEAFRSPTCRGVSTSWIGRRRGSLSDRSSRETKSCCNRPASNSACPPPWRQNRTEGLSSSLSPSGGGHRGAGRPHRAGTAEPKHRIDIDARFMAHSRIPPSLARAALCLVAAAGALLAGCEPKQAALKATPPPSITARVRVLDADVLIIDGKHVKLANAYAPESLLHARCWAESLASDHAANYVKDLVEHARSFDFRPTGQTDTYNRVLALVDIDGADLGDILYQQGLAARPVEPRFDWCQPISKQAEGAPKISTLFTTN
jgi:endonuclease YncB( thermonuclease family)